MTEAEQLEFDIMQKSQALAELRRNEPDVPVSNYAFTTLEGQTTLSALFGNQPKLLVIHNMGQGCRYCTLWADGINGILDHLESAMSVVLVSKDAPDNQRRMALDRGWKFRMASHGGGPYMAEQCAMGENQNFPGAAIYEKKADAVVRRSRTFFGPGDIYCGMWHFLSLAGIAASDWTPQFHHWQRPEKMDDGGDNLVG